MARQLSLIVGAFLLTMSTAWVNPATDERALYGMEGRPEENFRPREVAGWRAPYLADSTHTSVIHQIGIEDVFRPGPFVAILSFWYLFALGTVRPIHPGEPQKELTLIPRLRRNVQACADERNRIAQAVPSRPQRARTCSVFRARLLGLIVGLRTEG